MFTLSRKMPPGAFELGERTPLKGGQQHTAASSDTRDPELDMEVYVKAGAEPAETSRQPYEARHRRKILLGVGIAVGIIAVLGCIWGLAVGLWQSKPNYSCSQAYDSASSDLVFFVVGDWGRKGSDDQRRAARLMTDVSECMPPQFIVSTGDNFYPSGLQSANDSQFSVSFTNVYTAPKLQVPWYAVLGNHDYGDNFDSSLLKSGECLEAPASMAECEGKCCFSPLWQLDGRLTSRDSRWNATGGVVTRRFAVGDASLDIIFFDSNPIIQEYASRPWAAFLGGLGSMDKEAIKSQLQEALEASYTSGSKWRLVVGHHPVHSYGEHCTRVRLGCNGRRRSVLTPDGSGGRNDCTEMAFLKPWLKQYKVAAYINGHDHDQQLIKYDDDPVYYVVSGAGSETRKGDFLFLGSDDKKNMPFHDVDQGFLAVSFSNNTMRLHFHTTGSGAGYTHDIQPPSW